MKIETFVFPVEGIAQTDLVWLDIECDKIVAPTSWNYSTRTRVTMVGLAYWIPNEMVIEVISGEEAAIIGYLTKKLNGKTVIFKGTHSYDRLVLEGRWTYVRRGPSEVAGDWPHLENGIVREWINLSSSGEKHNLRPVPVSRSFDVASKDVPATLPVDYEIVLLHNVRDVIELLAMDKRSPLFDLDWTILTGDRVDALDALFSYNVFDGRSSEGPTYSSMLRKFIELGSLETLGGAEWEEWEAVSQWLADYIGCTKDYLDDTIGDDWMTEEELRADWEEWKSEYLK